MVSLLRPGKLVEETRGHDVIALFCVINSLTSLC